MTTNTTRPRYHLALIGFLTLLALASANSATASACYNYPCYGSVDAVAHRGDSQYYGGNSFSAIQSAINKGADWVEIDVQWNGPSQRLILIHDSYLLNPSCLGYSVESTPVSTLERCIGQPIVFFDNLLAYWTPRGFTRWMIELKATCSYPSTGCETTSSPANHLTYAVYNLLTEYGLHEKVWLLSFDNFLLQNVRGWRGGSPYPRLMKLRPFDWFPLSNVSSDYMDDVKRRGFDAVGVDIANTNAKSVAYAHSIGLLFATWAEGSYEPENEKAVYEVRPDFHITDRLSHLLTIRAGSGGGGGDPVEWECTRYSKTCG